MKRYSIDSPDRLKAAAPLMKQQKGVWAVNNLAIAWSATARQGKPERLPCADAYWNRDAYIIRKKAGISCLEFRLFS